MDYTQLLSLKHNSPVDSVVGRILDVGLPKKQRSPITGNEDLVQDLQLEDQHRNVLVVQFYGLTLGCFSRNKDDRASFVAFSKSQHQGKWIEVWNDSKDATKTTLKRHIDDPRKKGKGSNWWAEKGIKVMLKATTMCNVQWLVNEGDQIPQISKPLRIREPKPLDVPGSKQGRQIMAGQQQRQRGGPQYAGRNDQKPTDRRDEQRPQTDQRRQEPSSNRAPAAEDKQQGGKRKSPIQIAVEVEWEIMQSLGKAYDKAKIKVTETFIAEASKALSMQLKFLLRNERLSVVTARPDQLTAAIDQLALNYARAHWAWMKMHDDKKVPFPAEESAVRTQITTIIGLAENALGIRVPR